MASYDICSVCGWEDDAVQLANPCSGGGANKESLYEHQKLFEIRSIKDQADLDRDPNWRPLNEEEVTYSESAKNNQHWSFVGETAPEFAYWLKTPIPQAHELNR
jgi:hypothetical protein